MENILYKKAFEYAISIVKTYKYLDQNCREYVLSKQLLKSGTSIRANVAEANGAISVEDFSYKISIAYKESLETKYWLSLLKETGFIDNLDFEKLYEDADELSRILYSILKKTRINQTKINKETDN